MAEIHCRSTLGHGAASFERIRGSTGVVRSASVRQIVDQFQHDFTFEGNINTDDGVALRGQHGLLIRRDGSFRHYGHFRATGFPSYDCSLTTTLTFPLFPPGEPPVTSQVVFAVNGRVHGTNEPGDREYAWSNEGAMPLLASEWEGIRVGAVTHNLQFDTDWFGPAGDVLGFVAQAAAGAATFGATGVVIVLAGEAAGWLGLDTLVLPGLVGVVAAAGAGFVLGPGAMVPAFIVGAAVTAATVKQRSLTDEERGFADQVFGGQLNYDRILLTNLVGVGHRPFTYPGPGEVILVNMGEGYTDPLRYTGNGGTTLDIKAPGQLLIHELTHAWQIQHASFVPEYFCRAIKTAVGTVGSDKSAYDYGPAGGPWEAYGTEAQASVVEDWFAGSNSHNGGLQSAYSPMDAGREGEPPNPFYPYIRDHIRAGVT